MKRILVIFALIVAMSGLNQAIASEQLGLQLKSFELYSPAESQASGDGGDGAAHKGMIILQPDLNVGSHLGFGKWGKGYYGVGVFVPGFTFNVDFGVHDYVSVGPYIGFGGRNGFAHMAVGARGVFHWWQLMDDKVSGDLHSDKIDFYLPVHFGIAMSRHKSFDNVWRVGGNGGGGLGFRYYFVKKFGMNVEWGWQEMSWLKFGLTVNLN